MTGYIASIEKVTEKNDDFRQVVFTSKSMQLVLMSLKPKEEIGNEMHENVDQFFRIEMGEAKFVFNGKEEHTVGPGDAVIVPAGTHHNVINTSATKPLKLYTIYAPPNHRDGVVHQTRTEAEADNEHFDGKTTKS
jgi:mannose-6-phosphate isomerase-like protein (cupin superfamily)